MSRKMCRKSSVLFMVVALCGVVGASIWDGGGGGDTSWCTPSNWDFDTLPTSGGSADINCGLGYVVTVDCNSAECNLFRLGETGSGTAEVVVEAGGILEITAFELSTSGNADITLTMNGGTINAPTSSNFQNFGRNGTNTFNLNSGAINIAPGSLFRYGRGVNSTHTLNMYDGFHLNCPGSEVYLPESASGTGTTFNMFGGTLTGGPTYCTYGDNAEGAWNISGGTMNVTDIRCGQFSGTQDAELNFSGDCIVNNTGNINSSPHAGKTGELNISGTADLNISGNLNWPTSGGTYSMTMSGGTLDVGNVNFGEGGNATTLTADISGGVFTSTGNFFNIGNGTNGTATMTMTGGSVICAAEPKISGGNVHGELIMQGGTLETTATFGLNIGTGGTVDVAGGCVIMASDTTTEMASLISAGKIISSLASAVPVAIYDGGTGKTTLKGIVDPNKASHPA